jgi:hypothetical protein
MPVTLVKLERLVEAALKRARRPAWSHPLVIAAELGFELLPCPAGTAPELVRTCANRLVFACEAAEDAHTARVRQALARGLLLRARISHDARDVAKLAQLLAKRANGAVKD